jgi:hypothetical protein
VGTLEVLTEMKLAAPTAGMALIGVEFVYFPLLGAVVLKVRE